MDDREFYRELGKRLRSLRRLRHLTQARVATLLGIRQHMLSRYETGRHAISVHRLCELANIYEVGAALFFLSEEDFERHLAMYVRPPAYLKIFQRRHQEKYHAG